MIVLRTKEEVPANAQRLEGAVLERVDLRGAALSGYTFPKTVFRECAPDGADLSGAVFHGVTLEGAVLAGADLSGAGFHALSDTGAHWKGANLDFVQRPGPDPRCCAREARRTSRRGRRNKIDG